MALRVKVSHRAAQQIGRAADWWVAHRSAAPEAFHADLAAALELLARQPAIGAAYERGRVKGVRRLLLSRIRYFIYYRATPGELEVLAFWHVSRGKQPSV